MDIQQFETELKAIDPKLSIVPHPYYQDIAGIYYGTTYTDTAVPTGQIFDGKKPSYTDSYGYPHKTRPEALAQVKHFLWRMQNEDGFMDLITESL